MEQNNNRTGFLAPVRNYYDEVVTEGKRVTWPSREDVRGGGMVLLIVLVALSILLGAMDYVLGLVVEFLFT